MVGDNICCMRRIITKRKKELYSISSLLFHLLIFIVLLISLGTDPNENLPVNDNNTIVKKKPEASYRAFFTRIQH